MWEVRCYNNETKVKMCHCFCDWAVDIRKHITGWKDDDTCYIVANNLVKLLITDL